ncbi:hypothetical protein BT67DRAFT_432822 [Trichocladium antarcticum]|uniref:Uncharacterized protein n=1 Tax=Trichocladium antarcticum TaxID=1450529 RepID=A0AAN6ZFW6_9PEZI|nr:hypothetical protein BT67DRAFT_432822 [Trichocladium antarcticum]
MGLNLLDRIQAKIELFRLEQRYTRRRHRRSTFVSNAIYVDGEYIYQSPNTTGSSSTTTSSAATAATGASNATPRAVAAAAPSAYAHQQQGQGQGQGDAAAMQKRLNRWSSMPGFGSGSVGKKGGMGVPAVGEAGEAGEWRRNRVSFHDERY